MSLLMPLLTYCGLALLCGTTEPSLSSTPSLTLLGPSC